MRRATPFVCALAIVAASAGASVWLVYRARSALAGPLRMEPTSIELGDLMVRESRGFEVRVQNVSAQTVELAQVSSGCTCTNVRIDSASPSMMRLVFAVKGPIRGAAMDGSIEISLRHRRTGRAITLAVPVSGFVVQ
ncbi:MAG: hypothetical protein NUV77_14315 [Thermoguttaceae bacterium]|jgi:hypothetical protein|nr:hypothetical protein [Thermoguttaceae bacterium]